MTKRTILWCEVCDIIDSTENRVVTVSVCGHRVELCKMHRVQLLMAVKVSESHAIAYCDRFDEQYGTRGQNPTMAQVLEGLGEGQADDVAPETPAETPVEDLVSVGAAEETGEAGAPRSKRR